MIKQVIQNALMVLAGLGLVGVFTFASPVEAQTKRQLCQGLDIATGQGCRESGGPTVQSVIRNVINLLTVAVGIVAVIMIIIAGLKYITSGGDSANVTSAKNTILYAVVGLIIVALAQVIVRFVLNESTG